MRERAEQWPAAHPSFTQKVLPARTAPQQTAHYGCGGLLMAIHEETARMGVHKINNGVWQKVTQNNAGNKYQMKCIMND